ncbi:MAG: HRDC domain-containing protein [Gemmataceae bacterium]|nr:HRDC domain-containing protein [Gemmataceae bacterium]
MALQLNLKPSEVMVTNAREWSACREHLAQASVVGLDTEFVGEGRHRPELCLVQIATPETLYVIDPYAVGRLEGLWELLQDPRRLVVVHAGKEDIRICQHHAQQPPARIFDIQLAAGLSGLDYPLGYGKLVEELFGVAMNKELTLSNWRQRPLTQSQLRYAFDDVRYLLPAYVLLQGRLQQQQRESWAEEEFAALVQRALAEDQGAENWRRVKGLGRLDRQGLAIVKELYQWREEWSQRWNRPSRHVLSDHLLVRIARLKPRCRKELASLRGVPQNAVAEILEVIQQALALPPAACPAPTPRIHETAEVVAVSQLLQIVLHEWCSRYQVASNLAATPADLKAFAYYQLARRPAPEMPLFRGWRAQALLPELQAVLEGRRWVAVNPHRSHGFPLRIIAWDDPTGLPFPHPAPTPQHSLAPLADADGPGFPSSDAAADTTPIPVHRCSTSPDASTPEDDIRLPLTSVPGDGVSSSRPVGSVASSEEVTVSPSSRRTPS